MERTDLSEYMPIGALHFKGVIEGEYLDVILLPGDPPRTMVHNGKGWVDMDRPAFEFLSKEGYEQYRKQINAEIIGALVALDLDFDLIAHYQSEDKLNKVVDLKDIKDIIQQKIEKLEGESDGEVLS